jgi:putative transposase
MAPNSATGSGERERAETPSKGYLPRLAAGYYRGHATTHWTLAIDQRATGWLDREFHARWREVLLHAGARYHLICPAYVLMPDHIHVLLMGLHPADSDQKQAITFLRKNMRAFLAPAKWQKQAHDHVLREEERRRSAFPKIAHYLLENPIRAKLVTQPEDWEYAGCCVPGYLDLDPRDADFWPLFWRLREKLLR